MTQHLAKLAPFPFDPGFNPPQPQADTQGDIVLTADELAALLAETRDGTAALVRDETLSAQAEQLQTVSAEMKSALGLVVDLASHLDTATLDEHDRSIALAKVRRLAATLIEGQTDLFDKS